MRRTAALVFVALLASSSAGAVSLKRFTDKDNGFEISLPQDCRHKASPGTIEAVCAPSLDASASKYVPAAGAWLFEIDYEEAPADAPGYTLEALKAEAPAMVCGGADASGVVVSDARAALDGKVKVFEANVTCPALAFLGLPERRAQARVVVAAQKRFRMLARTPAGDAAKAVDATRAFLASFKLVE